MSDIARFIDERLDKSIVARDIPLVAVDKDEPLSFIDWVKYNRETAPDPNTFLARYSSYLKNWFDSKNVSQTLSEATIKKLYYGLINEIVINYTTPDEQRYLKNIDPNNSRDLAAVIPFFAQKIKSICVYYSTLRDEVAFSAVQNNLNGSDFGAQILLYNLINKALEAEDLVPIVKNLNISLSAVRNNLVLEVEDLYDTYPHYYDVSVNLPASAYQSFTDMRAEMFQLNQYDINYTAFINLDQAIVDTIVSYPFFLIELKNNLAIQPRVASDQLQFLKDSNFRELINNANPERLTLIDQSLLATKYLGVDHYYARTDSTGTPAFSSAIITAESEFANILNKRYPTVAAIDSNEFLKSAKEIGLFFKPDKIGLLHFTNFNFYAKYKDNLPPDKTFYFPDPAKYGNISSITLQDFETPFIFFEDNSFNKTNFANQYNFGQVATKPWYHIFRAYQSREQSLDFSNTGVARYVDSQEFFENELKNIWSNKDVYPLVPAYLFPIDSRLRTLIPETKTLVQYKNDVFGNEFGLYKDVNPLKGLAALENNPVQISECLVLDGHVFFDTVSGYTFNYSLSDSLKNYSGVILKTVTSSFNSTASGDGNFALSSLDLTIASYQFLPEIFCEDYINIEYDCDIKDGVTFISPGSAKDLLPDVPSDSPEYDPNSSFTYYDELVDAGVCSYNPPTFRSTWAFEPDFTFVPPPSAIKLYDGLTFFVANSAQPCGELFEAPLLYVEPSFYLDYRIPLRETVVNTTLSSIPERRNLYNVRHKDYGTVYFRSANSSVVEPLSSALSGVFIKYSAEIQEEINHKLINFDVFYDLISIETENYLIFETLKYPSGSNRPLGRSGGINLLEKGKISDFEKTSTIWFNELNKEIVVCRTVLFPELSATNYKIIYPKIYILNLGDGLLIQKYPLLSEDTITLDDLLQFSLIEKNINLNIVSIDKPYLSYNNNTGHYKLTYLARDPSNCFYTVITEFCYIDGTINIISNTLYKPGIDLLHQNFSNDINVFELNTTPILGNSVGVKEEDCGEQVFSWSYLDTNIVSNDICNKNVISNNQISYVGCPAGAITIASTVSSFSLVFENGESCSVINNFDNTSFSACNVLLNNFDNLVVTGQNPVFVTNTFFVSTISNVLYTFTYTNTGSVILNYYQTLRQSVPFPTP